jgi:hypothetical protein
MAISGGPDIVEDGLVLCLDAADRNCFNDYNIVADSENFTSSFGWVNSVNWPPFGIVANDGIAPNGTQTADKIIFSGASKAKVANKFAVTEGEVYTISAWMKVAPGSNRNLEHATNLEFQTYDTNNALANMAVGAVNFPIGFLSPDRWIRVSTTYTVPSGIGYMRGILHGAQNPVTDNSVYVWGVQIVRGSDALPYHPNTNSRGYGINLANGQYTGTLYNGLAYSDSNYGYFIFDGVNDYVTITSGGIVTNNISVDIWFNVNSAKTYAALLGSNVVETYEMLIKTASHLEISLAPGNYIQHNNILSINTWTNIVVSASNGVAWKVYKNGVDLGTPPTIAGTYQISGTGVSNIDQGRIRNNVGFFAFSGNIAITKIYNRALTAQEIQQNYQATKGRFGL